MKKSATKARAKKRSASATKRAATKPVVDTRAKKPSAPKPASRRAPVKKSVSRSAAAQKRTTHDAKRTSAAGGTHTNKPKARADLGAPIDGFFAKQPPHLRVILEELRNLIEEVAPQAESSLKWGMPFFLLQDTMMCAITGHKSHVNLVLSGPPSRFADPQGLLEGEGSTGRRLKLTSLDQLPRQQVRRWLRTAAQIARE